MWEGKKVRRLGIVELVGVMEAEKRMHTNLCVYKLCQCTDELWCCVEVFVCGFFVDELADLVPEGGFQPLGIVNSV
jgi:hypothetical protein